MKKANLPPEIVALLAEEANYHIQPFITSIVPKEVHKEKLVKDFIACFEPADSNSEVYGSHDVCSRLFGWKLDRSSFLNEYWVDIGYYGISRVWAKNKASVRKRVLAVGYKDIHKIVLVKKFDKEAFINSLTS